MKKVIAIFLAAILIFSLAACGGTSGDTNSKTETSTSETKTGDTSSANNTSTDGKTLIVYFSWSNNTEKMANYIHDKIGGDIERIEPVEAYPEDYNETTVRSSKSCNSTLRITIRFSSVIRFGGMSFL